VSAGGGEAVVVKLFRGVRIPSRLQWNLRLR
jgi:hypothetical protein